MGIFDAPTGRTAQGSPSRNTVYRGMPVNVSPSTPRRTTKRSEVNILVETLNYEFPALKLRVRSQLESPATRTQNERELCYDRLNECFYIHGDKLQSCLADFRSRSKEVVGSRGLTRLLLDCLPSPKRPGQASGTTEAPTPISSLAQKMHKPRVRATTPDIDGDIEIVSAPDSPTARHSSNTRRSGVKRRSEDEFGGTPKMSKGSTTSQNTNYFSATSDRSTTFFTSRASPMYPQLNHSFDSDQPIEQRSFASTLPQVHGAEGDQAMVSFETDITVPQLVRDRSDTLFSSFPSLTSSIQNRIDEFSAAQPHKSNPSVSRFQEKRDGLEQWRMDVAATEQIGGVISKSSTQNPSTTYETREAVNHTSPSQALSQMQLVDDDPSSRESDTDRTRNTINTNNSAQVGTLAMQGMFTHAATDIPSVDYRVKYELHRWSDNIGKPPQEYAAGVLRECQDIDNYDQLVRSLKMELPEGAISPPLGSASAWAHHEDPRTQYKARLTFQEKPDSAFLFNLSLQALEQDVKSCRFQRRYGSHRLLYVDIPNLDKLPRHLKGSDALPERLVDWLCEPKRFLGRTWHAVHFTQSDAKKHDKHRYQGYRATFLALEGDGLQPLSLRQVFNDFMGLENLDLRKKHFRKLFSRVDLGFSRTTETLIFKPSQVIITTDIFADNTPESGAFRDLGFDWSKQAHLASSVPCDMTDGCSIISVAAMKQIWAMLGNAETEALPAAVQGRIGGAKGVWVKSGPANSTDERDLDVWIEIRPSQLKFDFPKDDIDEAFDVHQWTFEVSSTTTCQSHERQMGSLHFDMIPLLEDRGVPHRNIEEVITEGWLGKEEKMQEVIDNAIEAVHWVAARDGSTRDVVPREEEHSTGERLPIGHTAKARYLLDHGFRPKESPYLLETMKNVAQEHFSKLVQKLDVEIKSSVDLMGIADPFGVLEPDTIHVGFSKSFMDQASCEHITHLDGRSAIITRFPMQVPSDIQKVKVVFHPELQHLRDCIIVPVKGPVSLPSKLQGGDLDGDRYRLIWDPRLVDGFGNAPVAPTSSTMEEFGVTKDTRTLSDVLTGRSPVQNFLREGFKARINRVPLGITSNFLVSLAYYLWSRGCYSHEAIQKLSELYTLLIDADKQGHIFDTEGFNDYKQKLQRIYGWTIPGKPMYKVAIETAVDNGIEAARLPKNFRPRHPNDLIFFEHVQPQMIKVLKKIDDARDASREFDDLTVTKFCEEGKHHTDPRVKHEVMRLAEQLQPLCKAWAQQFRPATSRDENLSDISAIIDTYCNRYKKILPSDPTLPQACLVVRLPGEPSTWDLLKASCLYSLLGPSKSQAIAFQLAGKELAYLKAHSQHRRVVISDVYGRTKLRKRKQSPD